MLNFDVKKDMISDSDACLLYPDSMGIMVDVDYKSDKGLIYCISDSPSTYDELCEEADKVRKSKKYKNVLIFGRYMPVIGGIHVLS